MLKVSFDIDYADVAALKPSLHDRAIAGEIGIIRNAPPLAALRELILGEMAEQARTSISDWMDRQVAPDARSLAHLSNTLSEMRLSYLMSMLFADMPNKGGFPEPRSIEAGAPRFQVPADVAAEWEKVDFLRPEALASPGYDPSYHPLLVSSHQPHRDLGRPCYHTQVNFWCALQDISEKEALLLFPEMYRDPSPDKRWFDIKGESYFDETKWGMGQALRVPMKAGDILVFSGDQLHCNPLQRGDTLRLSWEFRILSPCYDDAGWYRFGFINDKAFASTGPVESAVAFWKGRQSMPAGPQAAPWPLFFWMVNAEGLDESSFVSGVKLLETLPFVDDFRPWLICKAYLLGNRKLALTLLSRSIEATSSYFWAFSYAGIARSFGDSALEQRGLARSKQLASETKLSVANSAIDFLSAFADVDLPIKPMVYPLMPEDVPEAILVFKKIPAKRFQVPAVIKGIPYPSGLFKPRSPYWQEGSPKSSLFRFLGLEKAPARSFTVQPQWPPF